MKEKIPGVNYLHSHPSLEKNLEINENHCIVDRNELLEIQKFLLDNPWLIKWIGEGKISFDRNTGKPIGEVDKKGNLF